MNKWVCGYLGYIFMDGGMLCFLVFDKMVNVIRNWLMLIGKELIFVNLIILVFN